MSRWDRRSDEGQYYQGQRDDVRHGASRARGSSRSRSRSPESPETRSHSRSPTTQQPRHNHPASHREQRNHHRRQQQEEEEHRRRQEALDSRGGRTAAGLNGTGSGPGGTAQAGARNPSHPAAPKPRAPVAGIQMKLAARPSGKEAPRLTKPVANAFRLADDSDDSEPEEMPAECRMRMRNIGRDTPTSSGPNSFGKTKHGFCDSKKMFEKKIGSSLGDR
uniref:PEST proteolytic signal-containing nuclear protein n=1 Tax=Anopheles dirus TaxID=7168 RepID=A0A182N3R3_9DIPT